MKNKKILVCGLIILILIVFLIVFKNKIQRIFYPKSYEEFVSMYSDEYGVDENLIFAVIKAESNFQEDAVSHKDALGLMQIMKETAEDVARKYNIEIDFNNSEREILNVQNNIKIGTKYLAVLLEKYKNIESTLQNTLIMAQSTADEIKKVAKQEADQLIREAQGKAKEATMEIEKDIAIKTKELDDLQKQFDVYKAKMESLLISQLELLKDSNKE